MPLATAVLAVLALSGCTSPAEDPAACVPLVDVTPGMVAPGRSITVTVYGGCDRPRPVGGWTVTAAPVGKPQLAVTATSDENLVDGFSVEVAIPESFPAGDAYAGIGGWDYSLCDDGGSCASPSDAFTVSAKR